MLERIKDIFPKRKGASPLVTTVIIVAISFTVIGLTLLVGIPAMDRAKEAATLNEAMQNMRMLDNLIREVASEGVGAFRNMLFKISGGMLRVNSKADSIDYTYNIKTGILTPGTFIKEGNLYLMAGTFAKAAEEDLDDDGETELVLENEIIRIAILKNGSSSQNVTINTSELVQMLNYKDTNVNVTPVDSAVVLDGIEDTKIGTGYTELVMEGEYLPKAEAVAHIYTDHINYDIVYTLYSRADFLEVKIRHAYYK